MRLRACGRARKTKKRRSREIREGEMEVGFLGLGIMGKAMAANLLRHGFRVTVWNRTLSKVRDPSLLRFGDPSGRLISCVDFMRIDCL